MKTSHYFQHSTLESFFLPKYYRLKIMFYWNAEFGALKLSDIADS